MTKFILLALSSFVALTGCARQPPVEVALAQPAPTAVSGVPESDQYAVYDVVLSTFVVDGVKMLVIDRRGWPCEGREPKLSKYEKRESERTISAHLERVRKEMPGVTEETIEDFWGKEPVCVSPSFHLPVKYVFMSEQDYERIFSGRNVNLVEAWRAFRETYPNSNGRLSLSNVGFNREMNQALVEVDQIRGSLDGVGRIFLLRKEGGRWEVTSHLDVWYS